MRTSRLRFGLVRGLALAALVPGALAAGCSSYSPDLGDTPFFCGSGMPACPQGYACMASGSASVCVAPGVTAPDASTTGCSVIDQNLEPNDMTSNAFDVSSVVYKPMGGAFAGLSICPAGDVDTYRVDIPNTGDNIEVTVQSGAGGGLTANILTSAGTSLDTASPTGGGKLHGWVGALPAGTYYVQVAASTSSSTPTQTYTMNIHACTTPASQNSCGM